MILEEKLGKKEIWFTLQYNDEDEADPGRVLDAAAAAQNKQEKSIFW